MTRLLVEVERDGQTYAMTPETLIDELTYRSYRYNRLCSPAIPPCEWKTAFPQGERFEQRFQSEESHKLMTKRKAIYEIL